MACYRVMEFEGRSCTKCKRPIPVGERYVRQNNGYTRCTRPECGGDALGPPPSTHTPPSEDQLPQRQPGASDKRRRTGGHGYSGGDRMRDI